MTISQAHIVGEQDPTSWEGWKDRLCEVFGGGYRDPEKLTIFQHGMQTVFNWLIGEMGHLSPEVSAGRAAKLEAELILIKRVLEIYARGYASVGGVHKAILTVADARDAAVEELKRQARAEAEREGEMSEQEELLIRSRALTLLAKELAEWLEKNDYGLPFTTRVVSADNIESEVVERARQEIADEPH